jgi:preprotein translocase subunit SecG
LSSSPTFTFHIPSDFQGTLTFRADVYNVEGDYGWDSEQRTAYFGVLIVNVDPSQYHANDQLTVSFELESTVMTGPTTSFYYTASDAARIVKQGLVDTGGALQGSFLFTIPNAPATTYMFTVLASGNGHIVSGSVGATLIQDFILSISLDKESYLPGETMVVAYSIVPMDPAAPLPRLFLFGYEVIGLPFMDWQTSEASGVLDYAIPQDANEGNAIFEVQESYTGAIALEVFLIGSPPGPTVPSAPQNLQVTPGNGQVDLTWTAPVSDGGNPIIAYRIYRGTASGGEPFLVEIGNVLTYADTGLINGQPYYYVLTARNSVGEGANSTEVTATPVTVPLQPLTLQATAGYHLVTLTWAAPSSDGGSAITSYRIYRGTSGGSETLLASVGNTSSFTDTGLSAGQAYYYKVAAVNAAGEGAMSSEASATPSAPPSEGGTAGTPANEFVSLVLMVLAIIFLAIAAVLMFVNLRKMKQHTKEIQTEEKREPEEQQK